VHPAGGSILEHLGLPEGHPNSVENTMDRTVKSVFRRSPEKHLEGRPESPEEQSQGQQGQSQQEDRVVKFWNGSRCRWTHAKLVEDQGEENRPGRIPPGEPIGKKDIFLNPAE